ncbi:hypothetical protein PVL29_027101 [Vitis rotundifolia]|uniref:Uncharacterized protein n=1 Tax=Vitis rotundifolia TaxID=103349 RepID=A0AA38YIB0_VITRO|nr:hypothetical protein PVL29_027101 [Vitis rotundifolia]
MEANICDINHLDADVLLPPRKRLLAGLKKQSSDGDATLHPSPVAMTSNEFDTRLNKLLSSHLKNPSLTPEEIVEASRSAAKAAAKAAETARAAAEEKAAIAAKAMAAAKSALELIASVSEETSSKERYMKKNKSKKHVPVQLLYKKHQPVENYRTDEELARKLHRAMNSSPRISKNSSSSDWKNHKHKKPKIFPAVEKTRVPNGGMVLEGNSPSTCNGSSIAGDVDSQNLAREVYTVKVDERALRSHRADQLETDNGESGCSKEKNSEALDHLSTTGRKRGRMKLKKLPLSICTIRDRANPKEELKSRSTLTTEENIFKPTVKPTAGNIPLFSVGPSAGSVMPVEATSMWKCQEFKAPACVKQNKVVQS